MFAKAESFDEIKKLFPQFPNHKPENVAIKLAGEKNERGIVLNQRILRETKCEKISLAICNNLSTGMNCKINIQLPELFKSEDENQKQTFVEANSEKIIEFDVNIPEQIPAGNYPISFSCRAEGKKIKTPVFTFVKLPEWHVLGLFDGGGMDFGG